VKGRAKVNAKVGVGSVYPVPNRMAPTNGTYEYGVNAPYDYLVDNINEYYLT